MIPSVANEPSWSISVALRRSIAVVFFGAALWICAFFAPSSVRAELPVIDTAAIGQMIQQYTQMAQQLSALLQQVGLLKQQIGAITGHYGMGILGGNVNGWGSTSWNDIATMVGEGVNPGDAAQVQAYKAAQSAYIEKFPELSSDLQPTIPRLKVAYSQSYQNAVTGTALGESTFDQVNTYLTDVQTLQGQIEQTQNLKSAVDLNTAVNVRVAQMSAEILRMNAAQLRLAAARESEDTNGAAAQAEFFAQ